MLKKSRWISISKLILFLYRLTYRITRDRFRLKKWRPVRYFRRKLFNYVENNFKKTYVELKDRKLFLPDGDPSRYSLREQPKIFDNFILSNVKSGDVVVDIGANIGYYTILMSKLVGNSGKVYAFEPGSENFELLSKNIKKNNCTNVILENKTVSNETKTSVFYVSTKASSDHRIFQTKTNQKSKEIEQIDLDSYFEKINSKVDFVKCNIQGADFLAFKGMSRIVKNNDVKIMIEFSPHNMLQANLSSEEFAKALYDSDFDVFELNTISNQKKLIHFNDLINKYSPEKFNAVILGATKSKN